MRVFLYILLSGCSVGPWAEEAVLTRSLSTLTPRGDGAVDGAAYSALAYAAPSFEAVDVDGDGRLGPAELHELLRTQDPLSFDGLGPRRPFTPKRWSQNFNTDQGVRERRAVLLFIRAELLNQKPGAAVASEAELSQRALSVEDSDRALFSLRDIYLSHNLRFALELTP
jgi:hypothetical protein